MLKVKQSLPSMLSDSGSEEERREPSSACKAKTKKWWGSKTVTGWNSIYKGTKGEVSCKIAHIFSFLQSISTVLVEKISFISFSFESTGSVAT